MVASCENHGDYKFCLLFKTDRFPCRHTLVVMKNMNIRVTLRSLLLPRWRKDAKSSLSLLDLIIKSLTLNESDTNLMNFCMFRVEISYMYAKKEITRLTASFKEAYENRPIHNIIIMLNLVGVITTLTLSKIQ